MARPLGEPGEGDGLPADIAVTRSARIRTLAPLVALLVPLTLCLGALVFLVLWPCSGRGCIEPSLAAWLLVLFAVPTSLISGLPWYLTPLTIGAALLSSLILWVGLGALAGRRASRDPDAGWAAFAAEMLALAAGVIGGVLLGFAIIALWIRI